jgi:hypothetical protein
MMVQETLSVGCNLEEYKPLNSNTATLTTKMMSIMVKTQPLGAA